MKPLYISATLQDSGKTSLTCGLIQVLRARGLDPGYIKPVGQRYIVFGGKNIDEDAVLVHEAFGYKDAPQDMSPIAIERGFTTKFIQDPDVGPLEQKILDSAAALTKAHGMLVVEGTGHAGVGSCFGLSNARVAQLLGAKALIITAGGIGKPIDEIAASLALFRQHDVEVLGVVLNKVIPDKLEKTTAIVDKGLRFLGTRLIGSLPYEPQLTSFTVGQVADEFHYEVLCGRDNLSNTIDHTVVAAMEPQNLVRYIKRNSLVIMPGDRTDNMLVSIVVLSNEAPSTGGLILTGDLVPDPTILALLRKSNIPVLLSRDDTFTVSSRMKDLGFKIQAGDRQKIAATRSLVEKCVNVDELLKSL
jgi:BioD-like phosphotransacetylase family protein